MARLGGQNNQSFCVEAPGLSYVLTVCLAKSRSEVAAQARLLAMLDTVSFPTSRIVPLPDGGRLGGFASRTPRETGCCDCLLNAYLAKRPLRDQDLVPVFAEYAACATAFWRFRQYVIRKPSKGRGSSHVEMVKLADSIRQHGLGFLDG